MCTRLNCAALPGEWNLPGITFAGPLGACADTDTPWNFPAPFTTGDVPFVPQPNMSLVIEAAQGELRFASSAAPHIEPFNALELFSDDFEDRLTSVLDQFEEIAAEQGNIDNFCAVVGAYWTAACAMSGSSCPLPRPALPLCDAN